MGDMSFLSPIFNFQLNAPQGQKESRKTDNNNGTPKAIYTTQMLEQVPNCHTFMALIARSYASIRAVSSQISETSLS